MGKYIRSHKKVETRNILQDLELLLTAYSFTAHFDPLLTVSSHFVIKRTPYAVAPFAR